MPAKPGTRNMFASTIVHHVWFSDHCIAAGAGDDSRAGR